MLSTTLLKVRIKSTLCTVFTTLGCSVVPAWADSIVLDSDLRQFGVSSEKCQTLRITPTRLMDNETLFRAAEARQDSTMSTGQRLLNNRWLMQSNDNTFSGGAAIGKFVRMSLLSYWSSSPEKIKANRKQENEGAALANLDNYNLKMSGSTVRLAFEYNF